MSNVFFIGDLHFGHRNIHKFRSELGLSSEEEHREFLIEKWNKVIGRRDVVWILGDACFKQELTPELQRLRGSKFLILGNHDVTAEHFRHDVTKVCGFQKYKGFWLSHAPIHPAELRGMPNIHGHVHNSTLEDTANYFNASCENIGYQPISLDEIKKRMQDGQASEV